MADEPKKPVKQEYLDCVGVTFTDKNKTSVEKVVSIRENFVIGNFMMTAFNVQKEHNPTAKFVVPCDYFLSRMQPIAGDK